MTDRLINVEDLHAAAELAAMTRDENAAGFEDDALFDFVGGSMFHPPLDETSLVFGILIGRMAVIVRDGRSSDNGA